MIFILSRWGWDTLYLIHCLHRQETRWGNLSKKVHKKRKKERNKAFMWVLCVQVYRQWWLSSYTLETGCHDLPHHHVSYVRPSVGLPPAPSTLKSYSLSRLANPASLKRHTLKINTSTFHGQTLEVWVRKHCDLFLLCNPLLPACLSLSDPFITQTGSVFYLVLGVTWSSLFKQRRRWVKKNKGEGEQEERESTQDVTCIKTESTCVDYKSQLALVHANSRFWTPDRLLKWPFSLL